MRVDPEQVLVQDWIPTGRRIENSHIEDPFKHDQDDSDAQHRCG